MWEKNNKGGDAGWIAQEIFDDAALDLHSKCMAIDDQLAAGVLQLDEALDIYGVSLDDYMNFYMRQQSAQAEARFQGKTPKIQTLYRIKYAHSIFHATSIVLDSDLVVRISTSMDKLEDGVEKDQIKLKAFHE